jgi:hypothetical protein
VKMMLVVAGLLISGAPGYAQDQPTVAKLKADAEKLVKMTSGDKQKIQTYCEFADLSDQIGQANEDGDAKKADQLSKEADELEKKLGLEFVSLAEELSWTQVPKKVRKSVRYLISSMSSVGISTAFSHVAQSMGIRLGAARRIS